MTHSDNCTCTKCDDFTARYPNEPAWVSYQREVAKRQPVTIDHVAVSDDLDFSQKLTMALIFAVIVGLPAAIILGA